MPKNSLLRPELSVVLVHLFVKCKQFHSEGCIVCVICNSVQLIDLMYLLSMKDASAVAKMGVNPILS